MKLKMLTVAAAILLPFAPGIGTSQADAQDTLRAANCFPAGSYFAKRFETIVERVNERAGGKVNIQYVGGAPAIGSPFTLIQRVARGQFHLASCTGAYYQNVMPESDAWKLLEVNPDELRANGGWEYMDNVHRENNLTVLARTHYGVPFHLYLNQEIDKPDLKGLHLRVSPIYGPFFRALGATTQRSNMAQIYTLMENRTVVGYGWPVTGLRPDWLEVTEYRVDPGFYDADIQVLANLEAWRGLSEDARNLILEVAREVAREGWETDAADVERSRANQDEKGIKAITFTGADRDKWLQAARDAGWENVIENSPKHGPRLREYFTGKK